MVGVAQHENGADHWPLLQGNAAGDHFWPQAVRAAARVSQQQTHQLHADVRLACRSRRVPHIHVSHDSGWILRAQMDEQATVDIITNLGG